MATKFNDKRMSNKKLFKCEDCDDCFDWKVGKHGIFIILSEGRNNYKFELYCTNYTVSDAIYLCCYLFHSHQLCVF